MADLDIKRLLYDNADIQQKTFFVLGEKPSGADVRRANKFGRVIKGMGASSLASEFVKLKTTYQPSEKRKLIYYCYEENKIVEDHPDFSDDYLIDLLAMGDVKSEFIYKSLYGNQSYYCERSKIKQILDFMKSKHQAIVVHSDLANGKTIFLEGVKIRAIEQNYTVFTLANRSDDIYRETEQILRSDGPILIIIENYYDWFDVIDYISINWNENTKLILSGRSSIHDVTFDTLNESLEIDDIQELSVNNLDKTEITWLAQILDEFGLWGERASWSLIRKTKFIEKNCGGQFHAVLLTLMSAPQVVRRFVKITEELSRKQSYYKVIISILIFAVLGRKIDFDILYEFWGNIVSGSEFKRNLAINEIISFDSDKIRMRSAIAAQYILKNTTNPNLIVDTLIDIVSVANKLSSVNSVYRQYWKELVRFGNLHHILPENDRQILVIRYYEAIKSFEQSKNHPLFWLQYAIACITINEFERAEFYFDTAYSLARSRDWDLRQIDNHYARFLLSRSTYEGDSDTCMTHFRKARKIINNQMVGEDRRHYPYNVASYYGEFYEKFEPELSNKNRSEIGRAARYVLERIDKLPAGRQNNYYVKNCRHIMEYLVMETDVV
ncbi:MAG: hypothetical protein H8D34_15615 [Chloroflexi bacterium]|nr:hypothetical protein [Chloroflexota bacterium]